MSELQLPTFMPAEINIKQSDVSRSFSNRPPVVKSSAPEYVNPYSFKLDGDESKLSPMLGLAGGSIAGAIGGIVGGIQDNAAIRSQNSAINRSQGLLRSQIDDLKRQRLETVGYRRNEANDFLANYAVLRDPNKSGQMAQMYSSGQERFRSELGQNDQNQLALNNQISELERQKQKEKSGLEIFGQSIAGAANSALQLAPYALMG